MMTAGVAIDEWKLDIFKKHLDKGGFEYTQHPFTNGTLMLKVKTVSAEALAPIVKAANDECRRSKLN